MREERIKRPGFFSPKKISIRFLVVIIPLFLAFSLVFSILSPLQYKRQSMAAVVDKAQSLGAMLSYNISPALYFNDAPTLEEIILSAQQIKDLSYLVILGASEKVAASYNLAGAERAGYSTVEEAGISADGLTYSLMVPILNKSQRIGRLYFGLSLQTVVREIVSMRRRLVLYSSGAFVLGVIAVLILSTLITKPLRRVAEAAGRIAGGSLSVRAPVYTRDEVGRLAESFNVMVENLEQSYGKLEAARQNLEKRVEERTAELQAEVVERQRAEQSLRWSEELFRSIVESLDEGVGISGPDDRIVLANPSAHRILRVPPESLIGRNIKEFVKPEVYAVKSEDFRRAVPGKSMTGEMESTLGDGEQRILQVTVVSRFGSGEGYHGSLVVFSDITERKRAERAIREANERLQTSVQELEQRNREMKQLSELYDSFQSCREEKDIYELTGHFGQEILPGTSGIIYILKPSRNVLEPVRTWGPGTTGLDFILPDDCWALRRGKLYMIRSPEAGLVCRHVAPAFPFRPYLCSPLTGKEGIIGLVHILYPDIHESQSSEQLAISFSERVSWALENFRLAEKLKQQSIRDPLTGLFNRLFMEESLEKEIFRSARHKTPLGVIMIDIDFFKSFNDSHGHEAGDVMLKAVGTFLQSRSRKEDIVCRYGGEEFTVILPGATPEATRQKAENLVAQARDLRVDYLNVTLGPVTLSMGVAEYPDDGMRGAALLAAADGALFRAKKAGRNRVMSSGE